MAGSGLAAKRSASSLASSSRARSRSRLATRNSGRPVWRGAKELARAAQLEIELGQFEAVLGGDHGVEARFGLLGETFGAGHEDAVALGGAAADASAKLMDLGEAEALGVFDDHDGGVGDVDADLDDGGCDQDVDLAALEAGHGDFLLVGAEAAVEQAEAQAAERAGAQLVVHLSRGAEFGLLGKELVRSCPSRAFLLTGCLARASLTCFASFLRVVGEVEFGLVVAWRLR